MKYILLSLAVAVFVIGIHQALTVGMVASYPFMMLAVGLIIWMRLRIVKKGV